MSSLLGRMVVRRLTPTLTRGAYRSFAAAPQPADSAYAAKANSLNGPLSEHDPELKGIIDDEIVRQRETLALIASENYTSKAVLEALGSVMSNK